MSTHKRLFLSFAFLLLGTLLASGQEPAVRLRVMTFNLRYASNSKPNAWPDRRAVVKNAILTNAPDIVGTQEGLYRQLRDIAEDLPTYTWIGEGREGGSRGEFMAVFYKRDRLDPIAYGHFWLSDTPNVVGSRSWGNGIPRMVTWVQFREISSGRDFILWNTHFDHQSQPAREKSAELLISEIRRRNPTFPMVVTGDFNQGQDNIVHQTMVGKVEGELQLTDAWDAAEKREGTQIGTWNGWKGPNDDTRRIDWILISPEFKSHSAQVVLYKEGEQWPSDHFPVMAELSLRH